MKTFISILLLLTSITLSAQQHTSAELLEIINNEDHLPLLNNKLIPTFLSEYEVEARKYGVEIRPYINELKFILIEPASNNPKKLTGTNYGLIDRERKMILLSESCLIDRYALKYILFRELSHYFGVPYNNSVHGIMASHKSEGFSYSWYEYTSENDFQEIEYKVLFTALTKYIKQS